MKSFLGRRSFESLHLMDPNAQLYVYIYRKQIVIHKIGKFVEIYLPWVLNYSDKENVLFELRNVNIVNKITSINQSNNFIYGLNTKGFLETIFFYSLILYFFNVYDYLWSHYLKTLNILIFLIFGDGSKNLIAGSRSKINVLF